MRFGVFQASFFQEIGALSRFTARFFREAFRPRYEWEELVRQCFVIGYKSLALVGLTAFIMGLVMTMQLRPSMVRYGVEKMIPAMVCIAIIREIGPVITGLIFAGKIGSSIGAELGSMKVSEQIDAMEVSGVNPVKFLVVTRVLATTVTIPILSFYCALMALTGAFLNVTVNEQTNLNSFIEDAFSSIIFLDIWTGIIKAVFYGFTIGIVGCYKGYYATKGTEGVGRAANSAVVTSMFLIFIEEVFLVQVTNWFR